MKDDKHFVPDPRHWKWLIESFKHHQTKEELSKAVGIVYKTLYNWERTPKIMLWYNREATREAERHLGQVHKTLVKLAEKGNTFALKMYLERFDRDYVPQSSQKQEITIDQEKITQRVEVIAKEMESKFVRR